MENIKLLVKTKLESTMGEHLVTKENSLFYSMKDTMKYWIKRAPKKGFGGRWKHVALPYSTSNCPNKGLLGNMDMA